MAGRWQFCIKFYRPRIEPWTYSAKIAFLLHHLAGLVSTKNYKVKKGSSVPGILEIFKVIIEYLEESIIVRSFGLDNKNFKTVLAYYCTAPQVLPKLPR